MSDKHIVFIPYDIASKLNPVFELARQLKDRGDRITFIGPAKIREKVEAQGFTCIIAGEPRIRRVAARRIPNVIRLMRRRARLDEMVAALALDTFPDLLRDLKPDLILIDLEQHPYIIAAIPTGFPVAIVNSLVSLFKRPGLPPAHLGVIPGQGWLGSALGIEWLWLRFRLSKLRKRWRDRLQMEGLDPVSVLRHHARACGLRFAHHVSMNGWLIPFVYPRLPHLVLNLRELDFPHTPPPDYHFTGPLISAQRQEVRTPDAEDARLDALLSAHQQASERPLIYCSFGAFFTGDDTSFWRLMIEAFGQRPQWDVLFGLGGRIDPAALGPLPTHIAAFRWVPQVRALGVADAAVLHGGITSVNEAVSMGVPLVVFPFDTTDQHGMTARVLYHRLGVRGDRHRDDAAAVLAHVETILNDPLYRQNMQAMQAHYRRAAETKRALERVDHLIGRAGAGRYTPG